MSDKPPLPPKPPPIVPRVRPSTYAGPRLSGLLEGLDGAKEPTIPPFRSPLVNDSPQFRITTPRGLRSDASPVAVTFTTTDAVPEDPDLLRMPPTPKSPPHPFGAPGINDVQGARDGEKEVSDGGSDGSESSAASVRSILAEGSVPRSPKDKRRRWATRSMKTGGRFVSPRGGITTPRFRSATPSLAEPIDGSWIRCHVVMQEKDYSHLQEWAGFYGARVSDPEGAQVKTSKKSLKFMHQIDIEALLEGAPEAGIQCDDDALMFALHLKTGLPIRKIRQLGNNYVEFANPDDHVLGEEEFEAFMNHYGLSSPTLTRAFFTLFDEKGKGCISFVDFVTAVAILSHEDVTARYEALFKAFDYHQQEVVDFRDISKMASAFCGASPSGKLERLLQLAWKSTTSSTMVPLDFKAFQRFVDHLLQVARIVVKLANSLQVPKDIELRPSIRFLNIMDGALSGDTLAAIREVEAMVTEFGELDLDALADHTGFSNQQLKDMRTWFLDKFTDANDADQKKNRSIGSLAKSMSLSSLGSTTMTAFSDVVVTNTPLTPTYGRYTAPKDTLANRGGKGMQRLVTRFLSVFSPNEDVTFTQYVCLLAYLQCRGTDDKRRIQFVFNMLDMDSDGRIQAEDVTTVIEALYGSTEDPAAVRTFFELLDSKNDNHINEVTFVKMFDQMLTHARSLEYIIDLFRDKQHSTRKRSMRGNLQYFLIISNVALGSHFSQMGVKALIPFLIRNFGFSSAQVGLTSVAWFIGLLFSGLISHKFHVWFGGGKASLLASGGIVFGGFIMATGILQAELSGCTADCTGMVTTLIIGHAVQGFSGGLLGTFVKVFYKEAFKGFPEIFFYRGFYRSVLFLTAGSAVPVIAGASMGAAIALIVSGGLIGFSSNWFYLRKKKASEKKKGGVELSNVLKSLYPETLFMHISRRQLRTEIPYRTYALIAQSFFSTAVLSSWLTYGATYLGSVPSMAVDPAQAGLVSLVPFNVASLVTGPLGAHAVRRLGHRAKLLIILSCISILSILAFGLVVDTLHAALLSFSFGVAANVSVSIVSTAITCGSKTRYSSLLFSINAFSNALGGMMGPALFLAAYNGSEGDYTIAWAAISCLAVLGLVCAILAKFLDLRYGKQGLDQRAIRTLDKAFGLISSA